jgi:hypothetical protein
MQVVRVQAILYTFYFTLNFQVVKHLPKNAGGLDEFSFDISFKLNKIDDTLQTCWLLLLCKF